MGAVESTKVTRETRVRLPDLSDAGSAGGPLEPDRDPGHYVRQPSALWGSRQEGIASNILANRLVRLVQSGLL